MPQASSGTHPSSPLLSSHMEGWDASIGLFGETAIPPSYSEYTHICYPHHSSIPFVSRGAGGSDGEHRGRAPGAPAPTSRSPEGSPGAWVVAEPPYPHVGKEGEWVSGSQHPTSLLLVCEDSFWREVGITKEQWEESMHAGFGDWRWHPKVGFFIQTEETRGVLWE